MTTTAPTFQEAYARTPEGVWRAPGRANLIGEHTDYNGGFVLPFALTQGVEVAAARRDDDLLELRSLQAVGDPVFVRLDELTPGNPAGWAAYPAGVAWSLRQAGHRIGGASLLFDSDVPPGAGLSSSHALECATALALTELYGLEIDRRDLVLITQRTENDFVGAPTGIMDQSASLLCVEGHALFLDCQTRLFTQVPLDLTSSGLELLVIDTRAKHEHTDGGYATRREQCERGAAELGVATLREVTDLAAALEKLSDPVVRRRVRHVVTENHRVEATVGLLRAGAVGEVGALLNASHLSLRDDYEISWTEADVAVEAALGAGARGGRMMGGGFGGSVILLVPGARSEAVVSAVSDAYLRRGWNEPVVIPVSPAEGARRLTGYAG
jgi:galactokinase